MLFSLPAPMNMFTYFYKTRQKACNFHVHWGKFVNVISKDPERVRKHKAHIKSQILFTCLPKFSSQFLDFLRTSQMSFNVSGFFQPRKKMTEEGYNRNDMTKLWKQWRRWIVINYSLSFLTQKVVSEWSWKETRSVFLCKV